MTPRIVKTSSKGQITLPSQWRNQFKTDHYIIKIKAKTLVIEPFQIEKTKQEEVIFDSERDNGGKGIPVDEMIKIMNKLRHE